MSEVPAFKIEVRTFGDEVRFSFAAATANKQPEGEKIIMLRVDAAILRADPERGAEGRGQLFEDLSAALECFLDRVSVNLGGPRSARWGKLEPTPDGEPS